MIKIIAKFLGENFTPVFIWVIFIFLYVYLLTSIAIHV